MIVRRVEEKDFEAFRRLFDQSILEYLQFLEQSNLSQNMKAPEEREEITRSGFNFYLEGGSTFAAEENGEVLGYVASQKVPSMHGVDLWIEYIVVQKEFRRRGIGLALLRKVIDYAACSNIDRVYAFINPENDPSMQLHSKAGLNIEDWKIAVFDAKQRFGSQSATAPK